MSDAIVKKRPEFRNIHVTQILSYRLPPAGFVSIFHRVSGALMFFLLPFVVWLFDKSVTSEISYEVFTAAMASVWVKLVVWALLAAYVHHFIAGVRHLWMDAFHAVTKEFGNTSALVTLGLDVVLILAIGAKIFGLY
jgi:succinate dehydrogenase / fumarate reductase, cytochrome b subunit